MIKPVLQGYAAECRHVHKIKVRKRGLEPGDVTALQASELQKPAIQSAAESGAVGAENGPIDNDLAKIINAWSGLPQEAKQAILNLALPTV